MTQQTDVEVEILVCSSASGRASQASVHGGPGRRNARFRTLARAYESFSRSPITKTHIASTPLPILDEPGSCLATTSPAAEAFRQPDDTAAPPPLDSGLSMKFWSLSFDSVWDNVQSPRVDYAADDDEPPQLPITPKRRQQHYVSPDDYIPDSQPEPLEPVRAPRARRRRLTLEDHIEVDSDDADVTRVLESQDLDLRDGYGLADDIEDTEDDEGEGFRRACAGSPDLSAMPIESEPEPEPEHEPLEDSSQELPQRPRLPLARHPLSQTSANSQQSSSQSSQSLFRGDLVPSSQPDVPLQKRHHHCTEHHPPVDDDDIEDADLPDTDTSPAVPRPAELAEPTYAYARHGHNLYILSPEPPVACTELDAASLVTERLAKLAQDLDLEQRFTNVAVFCCGEAALLRPRPRPFDRGYWVLDTAGWPAGLRQRAWAFLAQYVGRGDAGWGVWCSRRSPDDPLLRLYCFAATAGHTYLLLYLASQRQILTTGATWMDGSRTPAISIPPRKRKDEGGGGGGSGGGSSSRPSSRSNNGRPGTATTAV